MNRDTKPPLGSVSSGTVNPEHLIPLFCEELRRQGVRSSALTKIERRASVEEDDAYWGSEEMHWDLHELFDLLDSKSPPYCYFGGHEGDSADYGYWIGWLSLMEDTDVFKVSDLTEVPRRYRGYILLTNDHGNTSLYEQTARKLVEIWSIV